jgi:hypothetical protein
MQKLKNAYVRCDRFTITIVVINLQTIIIFLPPITIVNGVIAIYGIRHRRRRRRRTTVEAKTSLHIIII